MTVEDWTIAYREFDAVIIARKAELRASEEQGYSELGRRVARGESAESIATAKARIEVTLQQIVEVDVLQRRIAERRHKGPPVGGEQP